MRARSSVLSTSLAATCSVLVPLDIHAQWAACGAGGPVQCAPSGNVGIGLAAPGSTLHVVGPSSNPLWVDSTNTGSYINIRLNGGSKGYVGYVPLGSTGLGFLNSAESTANLLVTDSGNVGIGTVAPNYSLHVVGSNASRFFGFDTAGTGAGGGTGTYGTLWFGGPNTYGPSIYMSQDGASYANGRLQFTTLGGQGNRIDTMALVNGSVGIGTTAPTSKLHLLTSAGNNFADGITLQSASTPAGGGTSILWTDSSGAEKARVFQTAAGNSFRFESAGPIMFNTAITGPTGANQRMVIDTTGNVGIGTINPVHPLQVAGRIGAQEIIVSSTGADYVFGPDYHLVPLAEVKAHISQNHHLPGVPPAEVVKEQGLGVGDMESKLLAKIEELTLHMIEASERIEQLEKDNAELRGRRKKRAAEEFDQGCVHRIDRTVERSRGTSRR